MLTHSVDDLEHALYLSVIRRIADGVDLSLSVSGFKVKLFLFHVGSFLQDLLSRSRHLRAFHGREP